MTVAEKSKERIETLLNALDAAIKIIQSMPCELDKSQVDGYWTLIDYARSMRDELRKESEAGL